MLNERFAVSSCWNSYDSRYGLFWSFWNRWFEYGKKEKKNLISSSEVINNETLREQVFVLKLESK